MGTTKATAALIDGDILVYKAAFVCEHTYYTLRAGDKSWEFKGKKAVNDFLKENPMEEEEYELDSYDEIEPITHAISTVKAMITKIIEATKPGDIKIYLTNKGNFRDNVATIAKYKGNRDSRSKPAYYEDIRKYLFKYYDAIGCDGKEADDALADAQDENTIICSIDKDLLQVPGKHYNWDTGKKVLVLPETGRRNLWAQVLSGDNTDNIPGIKGIGPVKAKKLLVDCSTEDDMRAVCEAQWNEYLHGKDHPSWVEFADDGVVPYFSYTHWETEERIELTPELIVEEIYQLVKVGSR